MPRDPVAGPEGGPETPFPIKLRGRIIKGFGRGSKELGIPTANIPIEGLDVGGHTDVESGVYYGWAGLSMASATSDSSKASNPPGYQDEQDDLASQEDGLKHPEIRLAKAEPNADVKVFPMVMSIGWNPYYKNKARTVEVHIMHKFDHDFYNALMNLTILGFIRQEKDYDGLDALIKDINIDIEVAQRSLERSAYAQCAEDPYLKTFDWAKHI